MYRKGWGEKPPCRSIKKATSVSATRRPAAAFRCWSRPGGGLNSRVSNWPTAVFNAMEIFKNDFRCITMDQRNANGGESTGPIPVGDPWGAFADDQLGLMDHLGIRQFFFMGYCIGGCFAMKLMERAPERVVAGVLVQTVGHRDDDPDVMYRSGKDVWAPELLKRRPDLTMAMVEHIPAQPVPRAAGFRLQRVAGLRAVLPDADAGAAGRNAGASAPEFGGCRVAVPERRDHGVPLEGSAGTEGAHDQPRAHVPEGASAAVGEPRLTVPREIALARMWVRSGGSHIPPGTMMPRRGCPAMPGQTGWRGAPWWVLTAGYPEPRPVELPLVVTRSCTGWTNRARLAISAGMNIGTWLFTKLNGRQVGTDAGRQHLLRGAQAARPAACAPAAGSHMRARRKPATCRRSGTPGCTTPRMRRCPTPAAPVAEAASAERDRHATRLSAARPRLPGRPSRSGHGRLRSLDAGQLGLPPWRAIMSPRCWRVPPCCSVAGGFLAYAVAHSGRIASPDIRSEAQFDHIDGLSVGTDVRMAGVKVGTVIDERIDPKTYLAVVT